MLPRVAEAPYAPGWGGLLYSQADSDLRVQGIGTLLRSFESLIGGRFPESNLYAKYQYLR